MEDMIVAQELNISDLQNHVQSQAMASIFEDLRGFNLLGAQLRDDTSVHEATK